MVLVCKFRAAWPLLILPALTIVYVVGRPVGIFTGRGVEALTRNYVSEERADSLKTRLDNEDRLIKKASER